MKTRNDSHLLNKKQRTKQTAVWIIAVWITAARTAEVQKGNMKSNLRLDNCTKKN